MGKMENGETHALSSPHATISSRQTHVPEMTLQTPRSGSNATRTTPSGAKNLRLASTTRLTNSGQPFWNARSSTHLTPKVMTSPKKVPMMALTPPMSSPSPTSKVDHGKTHANSSLHAQQSLRLTHVLTLPAILMLGKNAMKAPKDKNGLLNLNHALDQRPHQTGEICSIVLRKKSQFHPKLMMTSLRPLVMMMTQAHLATGPTATTLPKKMRKSAVTGLMVNGKTHADTSLHALTSCRTTHVQMMMTGLPATKVKKDKHGLTR